MARKGRKPLAAGHVEYLSGSELAKLRLRMILKTMLGELTVAEACADLGVCESRFHALRNQWLQESLELLEPRRAGRPPKNLETDETEQIAQLQATLKEMEQQAQVAGVRQEVAEILGACQQQVAAKKNPAARRQHRRRRQKRQRGKPR